MKGIFKKFKPLSLFMTIIALFFILIKTVEEDDPEDPTHYVHFDLSDPDIFIIDREHKNPDIKEIFKDMVIDSRSFQIPDYDLDKNDSFVSGWTEDGIYGFEKNDVFLCKSRNTTLKPVMGLLEDKRTFTLEYIVDYEGEIIKSGINKGHYCKNRIIPITMNVYPQPKATHKGWTDGKNVYIQGQKMVMPEHNVTLYAMFHYYRNLTYSPGNVDGLVGITHDILTISEGGEVDLAEETRIKREGYTIKAWHCQNDGIDYPIFYQYTLPDENVIMTAIWEPLLYTLVFESGDKSIPAIRIKAKTNEIITAPYLKREREGYTFIGWKIYKTRVYYPGDEIVVEGQMPGAGINIEAIWSVNPQK